MKELSIEEKAKRYDEIIKKTNKMHHENCEACQMCIEELIPELKESEDEKIRKRLLELFKEHWSEEWYGLKVKDAIAWLEKQGENNMGISEATKQKLEDNLNKALEKETPKSCNEFLEKQGSKKETLKERNICDTCEDSNGCLIPCCAKLLEKQGEHKPAWSEEDNKMSRFIGNAITVDDASIYLESKGIQVIDAHVWLEELKERVQPKQEWSEEDKEIIETICEEGDLKPSERVWLKSLKERYTWKPSSEQVSVLEFVMKDIEKDSIRYRVLNSVLEQLKKLMEE